ncbi:Cyclin-dependent kinase inhibitor 3 [Camellia lanceoleosa]|uniref:Cyclin-dependent kinase inhibitor 3 n=1 Tax=Camellia lanceoleosa TaxID=1840588 RepID=A0ACC0IWC2_9ERIC|nr:Cyclin-dependent kinase inhibitor 3 [Camellia lanceoleosa]
MGKYMRNCKGIVEIAVMEVAHVGARTRARALSMADAESSGTAKKRKVSGGELRFSSSLVHLRSRRRVLVTPENSVSPATSENSERRSALNDRCSSPSSDTLPSSCCSSNASSDHGEERFEIVDLENDSVQIETSTCDFDRRERRETTPSSELQAESGDLESTARPSEANSRRRSSAEKMPSETELEEFFAAAEKDIRKRFTEKYNYDIVKDVPLEGRYDWVRLKP